MRINCWNKEFHDVPVQMNKIGERKIDRWNPQIQEYEKVVQIIFKCPKCGFRETVLK